MPDFLDVLARNSKATIEEGYYKNVIENVSTPVSMKTSIIKTNRVPIIGEIKTASPTLGIIKRHFKAEETAQAMERGGVVGISVLTEPKSFHGSLSNLERVAKTVGVPVLMKDIIVDSLQLDAAARIGADAVLLIQALFDRGYAELGVQEMITEAHLRGLEVLLEVHDECELQRAFESKADLVGINNRNLGTLEVDIALTKRLLTSRSNCKPVVSESGIHTAEDVRLLSRSGADAFLVGSAIMLADNVESKVKELTQALSQGN